VVPIELELSEQIVEAPVDAPIDEPVDEPATDPVVMPEPSERGGNGLGIALTSVGTAAIVGGAVMFAVRGSTVSDYNDAVDAIGTPDALSANAINGLGDDARTQAGIGYATIGVGAALTGVGLVMLIRNGGSESNTTLSAAPTRNGFGVSLRTRF
jgi:hypothetical protein